MVIVGGNTFSHLSKLLPLHRQLRFCRCPIPSRSSSVLSQFQSEKLFQNQIYNSYETSRSGPGYGHDGSVASTKNLVIHRRRLGLCPKNDAGGKSKLNISTRNPIEDWTIIYRFKHIVAARAIQKIKLYQTVLSCAVITPVSIGCYFNGVLDQAGLTFVFGASILACGMLYLMGNTFGRMIGIIYASEKEPSKVKVSRLTFWGNRLDIVYNIDEFVPFSDMDVNPKDVYFALKQYSEHEKPMYLSLTYGVVHDLDAFQQIFGHIPPTWKIHVHKDEESKGQESGLKKNG